MAPAAILFDLDGTLVDSERDNVESVVLAVRRLGAELDEDDRRFIVGHSWNEIYARVVARYALTISMPDLIASAVDEKRALVASKGYTALPGALAAVRRLGERSRLAVVSGASRVEVREAVEALGLLPAFAFMLGAEDYRRGKPHPEPYLSAMERFAVTPGSCIVIEDAEPGVTSGRAAGARVIGVQAGNFSGYDLSGADVVVDTLDQVTDELCDRLIGR